MPRAREAPAAGSQTSCPGSCLLESSDPPSSLPRFGWSEARYHPPRRHSSAPRLPRRGRRAGALRLCGFLPSGTGAVAVPRRRWGGGEGASEAGCRGDAAWLGGGTEMSGKEGDGDGGGARTSSLLGFTDMSVNVVLEIFILGGKKRSCCSQMLGVG